MTGAITEDLLKQVFSESENQPTILFLKDIDILLATVNFSFFLYLLENVNTKHRIIYCFNLSGYIKSNVKIFNSTI